MIALLIRHAESVSQAFDAPLTDHGAQAAEALSPVLARLGAGPLYASPMARAQATLAPYAAASGLAVSVIDDLRERVLSPVPLADWQNHIRRSFADPSHAPPGGESVTALRERLGRALRQIEARGGERPTFVSHGGAISALFHAADPSFGFDAWKALSNPDLFEIEMADGLVQEFRRLPLDHVAGFEGGLIC